MRAIWNSLPAKPRLLSFSAGLWPCKPLGLRLARVSAALEPHNSARINLTPLRLISLKSKAYRNRSFTICI
jgi:hypothetical protein